MDARQRRDLDRYLSQSDEIRGGRPTLDDYDDELLDEDDDDEDEDEDDEDDEYDRDWGELDEDDENDDEPGE